MVICSMATEGYLDWLYHFIHGLDGNTDEKIIINLINVPAKKILILKNEFPEITFKTHDVKTSPRETNNPEGKCFKVTYLKGQFVKEAFDKFKEPVLWIDITALIRKPISNITAMFEQHDTLLMRRDFGKNEGKSVYACEIFGMRNKEQIDKYVEACSSNNKDWFSDQLALCKLDGNVGYIKFGEWSNFFYDPYAYSWSDRGKTGEGTLTKSDGDFTHDKFTRDLEFKFAGYTERFEEYQGKIKNRRILIHVDDNDWCYATTVKEVANIAGFDITIIFNVVDQRKELDEWQGDLVWGRCGSYRHKKLFDIRPDLRKISFSTITTGGESLFSRLFKHFADNKGEAGVIVQNNEAKVAAEHFIKKAGTGVPCFILPNGVNIKNFKKKHVINKRKYIVGFVGRSNEESEKLMKGTYYLDLCSDMAGLKTKIASNTPNTLVNFNDMPEFYQGIDLLLLMSNGEGCSNTINEALASGLPVIAGRNGWHKDVCKDDEIYFCDRNVEDVHKALEFFKDPKQRKLFGDSARDFAERHSWENMLRYYAETFNKMIIAAKENSRREPVIQETNFNKAPITEGGFMTVRAIDTVNLGKIERNGGVLWFTPGMTRQLPNDEIHKTAIAHYLDCNKLEIIN